MVQHSSNFVSASTTSKKKTRPSSLTSRAPITPYHAWTCLLNAKHSSVAYAIHIAMICIFQGKYLCKTSQGRVSLRHAARCMTHKTLKNCSEFFRSTSASPLSFAIIQPGQCIELICETNILRKKWTSYQLYEINVYFLLPTFLWNRIRQPNQCGATLIASVSFTCKFTILAEKKKLSKKFKSQN